MSKIARLIIASGENSPDMRYAAGFSTPDEFIWFEVNGESGVICSPLEFSRAVKQARPDVTVYTESEFDGPDRITILKNLADRFHLDGFMVPPDFQLLLADKLREAGLIITTSEKVYFPNREFKSALELANIIKSQRAAEAGIRRAFEVLRQSRITSDGLIEWQGKILTSELLRSEIDVTIVRLGMALTGTICAGGVQGSQPHNIGQGPLLANWPIVMDIFPRSVETGYWGDLTRTVVKGKASDLVKKAFDAVLAARELGKSLVKVGAIPAEIHNAARHLMEEAGFHTGRNEDADYGFFHGLGHGVGLDIHESPRLSPRNSLPLRGGEVVTVEPGLYYPEWGGIRLEDLMFVEPEGAARCLTEVETFLEIE